MYCWICIVYSWLHPPKTSQQSTLIDQFSALFTHYISCLRFRWIPVQETLAHSRMALMLLLQCYGVHMHSFTAWWTLWTDGMKWWRGKRRGMHGNVNSHITLVRVDTVEQCFWCHPFDGETTLKGHRSVRTTAVLTRQDIQTPNEHQQACSLISYCPI